MNPAPASTVPDPAERLCELVCDALALPAAERGAFLARACADDAASLAEALSLVDHDQGTNDFLRQPAYALTQGGDLGGADAGSLQPGDMLGEYRVVALLGEGGMGEVYLAEDTKLERRVAVKVLKRRLDDASLARRFRHEKKVLAGLTHPNIARLYGVGTTAENRSYLVMEYVEGERLDRYCDTRGSGVGERLALFRKVCSAVSYAHQNLVVHRDLKPANIRVTPEGEPKLLDFGIAKLLDPEGTTASRLEPTLTLARAMTPEYASPEQIKGETITTASDVYSLGVVLYELLCGQRPHAHLKGRRVDELARAVCEEEPSRASAVAGRTVPAPFTATEPAGQVVIPREPPARLRRLLEGDLDNIAAKALRKEPARRYAGVAAFSDDVRRHCEGLPVRARPDTLPYRTGKFVRRNKAGVVAAALVVLALVGGLVATALSARRANRRFEDVRRLANSILFEIEPQIANLPGSTQARSTLVKRALEYLDDLSREAGSRRDLQRELAAAYEKVGDVQGRPGQPNLDDFKGALASYAKARGLRQTLLSADGRNAQARQELAVCDENMGVVLWWSNQTAAAQARYREALILWRGLVAAQPRSVEFRHGLASVLTRIADVLSWNSQSSEAMATYQQALPILRSLVQEAPQDPGLRLDLPRCLQHIAEAQKDAGDYAAAMNNLAEAGTLDEALLRQDPNNNDARHLLWHGLYLETETLLARKSTARALETIPRMVAMAQTLARSDAKDTGAQHDLAISLEARAAALQQAERWPEALEAFQAALAVDAELAAHSPENGEYAHSCGTFRSNMGRIRFQLGQWAQAEADARAAQDLLRAAADRDPDNPVPRRDLIAVYELRGDLYEKQGQPAQARQWFERGLREMRALAPQQAAPDPSDEWTELGGRLSAKTAPEAAPKPAR